MHCIRSGIAFGEVLTLDLCMLPFLALQLAEVCLGTHVSWLAMHAAVF